MARGVTYQRQYIDSCSLGFSNTQTLNGTERRPRWRRAVAVLENTGGGERPLSSGDPTMSY